MLLCVGNFFGVNNVEFEDYKTCVKQGKKLLNTDLKLVNTIV